MSWDAEREAIRARLEAATKGPWHKELAILSDEIYNVSGPKSQGIVTTVGHVGQDQEADAELIAHAPADLRRLLDRSEEDELELVERRKAAVNYCEEICRRGEKIGELMIEVESLRSALAAARQANEEVESDGEIFWRTAFARFRRDLRNILATKTIITNPGSTDDELLAHVRDLVRPTQAEEKSFTREMSDKYPGNRSADEGPLP